MPNSIKDEIWGILRSHKVSEAKDGTYRFGSGGKHYKDDDIILLLARSGVAIPPKQELAEIIVGFFDHERESKEEFINYKYPDFDTIEELIDYVMKTENIVIDKYGVLQDKFGATMDYTTFADIIAHLAREHQHETIKDLPRKTWGSEHAKGAVKAHIWNLAQQFKENFLAERRFDHTLDSSYLNQCFDWFCDAYAVKTDRELTIAMLKQWMWQVKRYMYNLPVSDPYFVNIFGINQGTGKTNFIKALTDPIQPYRIEAPVDAVADSRNGGMWTTNYVILMDELKIEGDTDVKYMVSALKNILTSTEINFRELGTHNIHKGKRVFSAFGTSNVSITDVIRDESGMRRFFEIVIDAKNNNPQDARDRVGAWMESVDHMYLWKAIDENLEQGYLDNDLRVRLQVLQSTYKRKSYLSAWITAKENSFQNLLRSYVYDWVDWGDVDSEICVEHDCTDLFMDFKQYVHDLDQEYSRKYPITLQRFVAQLKSEEVIIINKDGIDYGFTKL